MKRSPILFLLSFTLTVPAAWAQFTPGRVVVLQENNTISTGNSGTLLEYLPDTAGQSSPTVSVALPASGGDAILFGASSSTLIHNISRTPDGAFVVIPGFANTTAGAIDSSTGAECPRVVATVKYDGTYARPIASATAFSGNAMRSASADGWGNFWAMGSGGGTIWMNGPATVQGTTGRATIVENGNLYNTRSAGVYWFPPGGTPTATTADELLMAAADMGGSPAPAGFAVAPSPGTIGYLANYQGGNGIARYDYNSGSGTWVFSYKFTFGEDPIHIAVDFTQSPPVLYVVGSTLSKLYRVVDPEVGGATTATVLATVTSPAKFRGVALSPVQPAAPVFTVQPASQCIDPGNTLVLGPVAATGANPNGWTWKFGNTTLTDGYTASGSFIYGSSTDTLNIQGFQGTDYGTYTAVAVNNGGSTVSSNAVITPCSTCITIPPASITNVAGTTASFTVTHVCVSPTYGWFKDGIGLYDIPGKIAGSLTAALTIYDVQDADAGNYSIKIYHASGEANAGASLTVLDPPMITQDPANVDAAAGTTANFTVTATGGSLHYQWSRQGSGPISGATASSLSLPGVSDGDAGSYRCVVTNLANSATSAWATLTVGHAPQFTTSPASLVVTAGVNTAITAVATGTATINYSWKHNSDTLSDDGHYSGTGSGTLNINNVQAADAQTYSVTAQNTYGSASASAVLKVVTALPPLHTVPGLVIYEPFNYPHQAYPGFPAPSGWVNSWQDVISAWNEATGQPAYWERYSQAYCTIEDAAPFYSRVGEYPWKGIDCNGANRWYWSSAPNNNHLNFGGINQTNGAAYFSLILQISQGSALSGNKYDVIAGFTSGSGSGNADNWIYKLCTHTSDGADWYQLGVFKGGGSTINAGSVNGEWAPTLYGRDNLHLIVGCYKFNTGTNLVGGSLTNDDVLTLWIDPPRESFGAAEGSLPAPSAGGSINTWGQNAPITEFALKGLVEPASKRVSDLRIGTTWASVTHPYYPAIQYVTDLSGLTLSWPAKDSADVHGSGYSLRESVDLVNWTTSANAPYQDGTVVKAFVIPGTGPFFRLVYP